MDSIQKTKDDYNRIAPYFSATRHEARELRQFTSSIRAGQRILDWGCGNGRLIYILHNKGVEYVGVDQSSGLVEQAQKIFEKEVREGWVKFYCTENGEAEFPENYFDLVFMIASFHHLPDEASRKGVLNKVFRELKPSGTLLITVWNLESAWAQEKLNKGYKKIGEYDYLVPWKTPDGEVLVERYYHHFTQDELEELLRETGLRIEEMYYSRGRERVEKDRGENLVVVAKKI